MDADKRKSLEKKRASCKAALTRLQTFISSFNPSMQNKLELKVRYDKLPDIWQNYLTYQNELEFEDEYTDHAPDRDVFESQFYSVQSQYLQLLEPPAEVNSHNGQSSGGSTTCDSNSGLGVHIKLPTINLPKFAGNVEQWLHFKDTFEALIINNSQLSNIQKFHYLLSSIQGEAHKLVQNLPITNDNFEIAWQLVTRRYHNTKLIASTHVRQLLHVPAVTKGSGANLRGLINTIQANVHALNALVITIPLHELLINQIILERIDTESRKEWELHSEADEMSSLEALINFLERKCKAFESIAIGVPNEAKNKPTTANVKLTAKAQHAYVAVNRQCILCAETHALYRCSEFAKMSTQQRFSVAKQHKLCFNCLTLFAVGHECSTNRCRTCNKKHHTMLHLNTEVAQATCDTNSPLPAQATNQEDQATARKTYCTFNDKGQSQVLLGTAVVTVKNTHGQYIHCRALLDSASQINFVTESLVQKLKLKRSKHHVPIQGINEVNAETTHTVSLHFKSRVSNYTGTIDCAVLPRITGTMPATFLNSDSWGIPEDLVLADEQFNQPGTIELLLGAPVFYDILRPEKLTKPGNFPVVQNTELGWTIAGKTPIVLQAQSPQHVYFVRNDTSLETQVQRFWEIESVGFAHPVLSPEEQQCETHFSENTTRHTDGRFIVKLPTKADPKLLGNSRFIAERRLNQIEKRLDKNPELKAQYHSFMDEYRTMEHMKRVEFEAVDNNDPCFYLPHHPVFKDSSTTSTRVVFDASAKSSSGMSLNDILHTGPTIQQDLYSIVLRFRTHNIAIVADIAKMYRQILVHHDDHKLQRILWRPSAKEEAQTFNLTTVTYGTTCAPFLATRCLQQVGIDNEQRAPRTARIIKEDFYVDDLLSGCSTLEEAKLIYKEVSTLLNEAGFPLRKWSSNAAELLEVIPEALKETKGFLSLDHEENVSTLGLLWDPKADQFRLKTGNPSLSIQQSNNHTHVTAKITKRRVLSTIASIFDPLGLVSPVVIRCKMFMQSLWQEQIGWDEPLTPSLQAEWTHLCEELPLVSDIKIPRNALSVGVATESSAISAPYSYTVSGVAHNVSATPVDVQIHGFCDSSERAYGACLYIRSTYATGQIACNLLCSKSKVAPVKRTTLPRLELCGALLLAQLCDKAIPALNLLVSHTILWTDSTLVLHWLAGSSSRWKTFVGNRVATIQELTARAQWRHVPTACNPADLVSRGVDVTTLNTCDLWWHGPEWLILEPSSWPILDIPVPPSESLETRKSLVATRTAPEDWTQRYSKLSKLIRVTAYCRRFINNARLKKDQRHLSSLTSKEMEESLLTCVKLVQSISFHNELAALSKNQPISPRSNLKSLTPFVDQQGLLRIGGRLQRSSLPYDAIHQLILPVDHHLTNLVLVNEHVKLLHAGPQLLIASIRQRFWIPSIKRQVRKMIFHCSICFRLKAQASQQLMGELPSQRIQPTRPFRSVGVDYAGPVLLKLGTPRSKTTTKGYIAVFVCLATKAVHLEVVTALTTDAFVAALRRFISRRGKPSRIQSDNGTNFKGAAHQLHELYELLRMDRHNNHVQDILSQDNCDWVFIPPHAPHFGGLWEAAVKSMKYHLKRVIGDKVMTYEELTTLLSQIEACMNSRPLCTIPNDPHDFNYLSPGHFLIGEPLTQIPSVDLCDANVNRLTRWQQVQQQLQQFWKRWCQDYLQELQQRPRWHTTLPNLQAGAVVLLRDDNVPPLQWRLGVIEDTHMGRDNIVRVVSVRTPNGTFKRPITKVSVLPFC